VWEITTDEKATDSVRRAIATLNESIESKIGDHLDDNKVREQVGEAVPLDGDLLEDLDDKSVVDECRPAWSRISTPQKRLMAT
jgi:hypothetical protein